MNILLDTHILLWFLAETKKLPQAAVNQIENAEQVFFSPVNLWEIGIKTMIWNEYRIKQIEEIYAGLLKSNAHPQMLLLIELAHTAADRVYQAIVAGQQDSDQADPVLLPILQPHNTIGDTTGISYFTSKDTYQTGDKCHLSHVVKDSNWEETAAKTLEWMPQVKAYVKNVTKLDWYIPYTWVHSQNMTCTLKA
jgi:PIN domain nuclease of toxin-antitoxin system